MQLVLNDVETQAPVILHPPPMTDDEFYGFCQLYPDFRIERTAEGEVVIMPGTGLETAARNSDLIRQLGNWAIGEKTGQAPGLSIAIPMHAPLWRGLFAGCFVDRQQPLNFTPEEKRKFSSISGFCGGADVALRSVEPRAEEDV